MIKLQVHIPFILLSFSLIAQEVVPYQPRNLSHFKNHLSESAYRISSSFNAEDTVMVSLERKFTDSKGIELGDTSLVSKEDLLELTDHPYSAVRFYSMYYLAKQHKPIPYLRLAKEHINDIAKVKVQNWSYGSHGPPSSHFANETLGEIFLKMIGCDVSGMVGTTISLASNITYPIYLQKIKRKDEDRQTFEPLLKMDSLIVSTPSSLELSKKVIIEALPDDRWYQYTRTQVEEGNPVYAYLLSKYKKEGDVELIIKNLRSVKHIKKWEWLTQHICFGNPQYFKYLKGVVADNYQSRPYGFAVCSYKNVEALELIKEILELSKTKGHKRGIRWTVINGMARNYDDVYAELLLELLEIHKERIDYPKGLWQYDKSRLYNIIEQSYVKEVESRSGPARSYSRFYMENIKENAPELVSKFEALIKSFE